jgi:hypothetical protein
MLRDKPTGVIFNLKNNYGWRDKNETEHTGPNGGPIQTANIDLSCVSIREIDRELMKLERLNAGAKKAKTNTRKTKANTTK